MFMKYLNMLLIFIPLSIAGRFMHINEGVVFLMACLSIVPLAVIIGDATEQISLYSGPKIGGLLNATMGNVPELLIGIFAVKAGLYNLVLASMAGSIIGNILLVLGFSIMLGGFKFKVQTFNRSIARSNFTLLIFAGMSIIVPFALKFTLGMNPEGARSSTLFSLDIAIMLLFIYILGLVFSLVTHKNVFAQHDDNNDLEETPKWSLKKSVIILGLATFFVAIQSEALVATVEVTVKEYGLPEVFIGIIIIPILGNVAEHASAMIMAVKNKLDISIEIAVGSSMQIALFVAPVLVILSFLLGKPMEYVYHPFEVVSMVLGITMTVFIFKDGKTNWLEGVQLVSSYAILAVAFFYI